MDNTIEKNGIIYFKNPNDVLYTDWVYSHLDCDTIIKHQDVYSDIISVLCFSKSKEYNSQLKAVQKLEFPDDSILRGVDSKEVNCI